MVFCLTRLFCFRLLYLVIWLFGDYFVIWLLRSIWYFVHVIAQYLVTLRLFRNLVWLPRFLEYIGEISKLQSVDNVNGRVNLSCGVSPYWLLCLSLFGDYLLLIFISRLYGFLFNSFTSFSFFIFGHFSIWPFIYLEVIL